MAWDPTIYGRYADERGRPYFDMTSQVRAESPARVLDLGCGSGELTAELALRWPAAEVVGIDSSPEMLGGEQSTRPDNVRLELGDATDTDVSGWDVIVSNAMLQWIPNHATLLARWSQQLKAAGWLAFSVPANFDAPSHQLMRDLAASQRWRETLTGVLRHDDAVMQPAAYLDLLQKAGLVASVWQTEYLHLLTGPDPVLAWVTGTGLRPILNALSDAERAEFVDDYAGMLRTAYPAQEYGTVFPFRRTFAVAHRPG